LIPKPFKHKSISIQRSNRGREARGNRKMTKRSVRITSLATALILGLVIIVKSPSVNAAEKVAEKDQPAAVRIDNFSFVPQTLTVPVGTTVTWTNRDDIPHTAVSTEGVFKSKVMDTDEKFSYTFTKAGTYPYYCTIHPKMTGKIVVQ
jgi:plastocyanin